MHVLLAHLFAPTNEHTRAVEAFAYGGPEGKQHWGGKAWKDYF